MTAPQITATTDPQSLIAALQQRLDAALAREAALAEELAARDAALAQRNSEFGERIEHQTATIDVLKVMSASPGRSTAGVRPDRAASSRTVQSRGRGSVRIDERDS